MCLCPFQGFYLLENISIFVLTFYFVSLYCRGNFSNSTKLEYLPAADGEVVEPIVDAAMLKEAEKNKELARIKRENAENAENNEAAPVVKKELTMVDLITLDTEEARQLNDAEIADFAITLTKPGAKKAAAVKVKAEKAAKVKAEKADAADKPAKVKAEKDSPEKEKTKKSATGGGKTLDAFFSKPAAKKPVKLTVDTSDEESDADVPSDSSMDSPVVKKDKPTRATKPRAKYSVDLDSDESEEEASKRGRNGAKKTGLDDTFDSDLELVNLNGSDEILPKPKKVSSSTTGPLGTKEATSSGHIY